MDENKNSSRTRKGVSEDKKVNDSIDYYLKEQKISLIMAILALIIAVVTFVMSIVSIL